MEALNSGKKFVIRLKATGDFEKKMKCSDMIRGEREFSENDIDTVLLKTDGMPTYHFAHVVDDYLMCTTDVLRADEWLASLTLHLELWEKLGWTAPRYGHFAPIQKIDEGSRRKLSKRKDPEANIVFFEEAGYPQVAVIEYLLNLANSSFEDWRKAHPTTDYKEFPFYIGRMNVSGALFDINKLNDISKNVIGRMNVQEVYEKALAWAEKNDKHLYDRLSKNPKYSLAVFGIERGGAESRKDISSWGALRGELGYFFDDIFSAEPLDEKLLAPLEVSHIKAAVSAFLGSYDEKDNKDIWFGKIKKIATELGFAESTKAYKIESTKYKGTVADVAKIFSVLLTGKTKTPDLYEIMQVMGKERVVARLNNF